MVEVSGTAPESMLHLLQIAFIVIAHDFTAMSEVEYNYEKVFDKKDYISSPSSKLRFNNDKFAFLTETHYISSTTQAGQ